MGNNRGEQNGGADEKDRLERARSSEGEECRQEVEEEEEEEERQRVEPMMVASKNGFCPLLEETELYDQNRNLTHLHDELQNEGHKHDKKKKQKEKQKQKQDQQQIPELNLQAEQSAGEHYGGRKSSSPVSSLDESDDSARSGNSASSASRCGATKQTLLHSGPKSNPSSASGSTQLIGGNPSEAASSSSGGSSSTVSTGEHEPDMVLIDMFELKQQPTVHSDNSTKEQQRQSDSQDGHQEACDQDRLAMFEQEGEQIEPTKEMSLAQRLGRRMSMLPLLLRRPSASVVEDRGCESSRKQLGRHVRLEEPHDDSRRSSLPLMFGFISSGSTTTRSSSNLRANRLVYRDRCESNPNELNKRLSQSSVIEPPPTTTVAGVGGTVTTVTRKKRKTAPLPRLVAKNGQVNLFFDNIDRRQYFRDLFVTMIDIKWRYNLAAAAFGFVLSWLFFACIWYVVLYVHDDLNHENDPNWSPCIVNVYSFAASLLFSIETQSTLGFGSRIISVECPGAIVIFCMQLIFGVVIECLIVGMVFAKLTRPTKRSQTIMYSKCATICLREDQLCLTFRVGDVRSKSHIIGATIRASLVSQKITREGEIIPFCHHELNVTIDNSNSLLLIWPVTIVHVIDDKSPFYHLSRDELTNFKFELITVLEGTVESTGQSIQVRSSYLPSEVKWGFRFEPIVSAHGFGRYAQTIIDYNKFNRLVEVETPNCSACDYYAQRQRQ